jgi:hypothetical protein
LHGEEGHTRHRRIRRPDPRHGASFEFCENGAKAVSWEATHKRVTPDFFARHTVSELFARDDHALEAEGRVTHPLKYDAATDRYLPVARNQAFTEIGAHLRSLPDPDLAEFHASGRTSNEASFLYQLFVCAFGTNNFPDCLNMCQEATSTGLPASIGVGKGTVTLDDFERRDAIFPFGHNPGTNHPRMLTTLREARLRDVPIVMFNPLKERSLERFKSPQSPVEMTVGKAVPRGRLGVHEPGRDRKRGRPVPFRHRSRGACACEGAARDHLLRHGHHPAPPRHRERAAAGEPAAARDHRTRRRRHPSAARSLQRAG